MKKFVEEFLLKVENLSKSFGENTVLKDINFTIKPGEIVGLVGENGAGKSTLMKIIFGMEMIQETGGYGGSITFEGKEVHFLTPFEALGAGVGMVHQEFSLIPGFAASENIVLNRESTKRGLSEYFFGDRIKKINVAENTKRANKAIEKLGVEQLYANAQISEMPVAHKQFTEIAREIEREKTKLLVLDEPTAVLTEEEAKVLLESMRNLAKKGIAIIFITHRLQEILDVADKVIVLRDGVLINTVETKDTDMHQITEWMIGRKMLAYEETANVDEGREDIICIKDLWVDMPGEMVKKLNLNIKKGEILGLGGMAGQGKIGIANGVMGLYTAGGEVTYQGRKLSLNQAKVPLAEGMFFVSEDRKGVGLLLEESIERNIAYPVMQIKNKFFKKQFGIFNILDEKAVAENAKKYIDSLEIRCTSSQQLVRELSGGNQQKICLAKAFTMEPDVLFVSEPTRGIDIGAKQRVLETLKEYNQEKGTTIIIASSEIEELRSICDRIAVINEGKVAGILPPSADILEFGKLMVGIEEGRGEEQWK